MYVDENYQKYVEFILDYVEFDMRAFALQVFGRAHCYMDKDTGRVLVDVSVLEYDCYMSTTMVHIIMNKLIAIGLIQSRAVGGGKIDYYINMEIAKTIRTNAK